MSMVGQILRSTVGKKFLVAVTGAGLFLFVIGHMAGNLQIFLGRDVLNQYAHFLKSNAEILWPVRIVMLLLAVTHIVTSVVLTFENHSARGISYEVQKSVGADFASRTMIWTGGVVFCFVGYHLGHFTLLWTHPEYRTLDVYDMVIRGFRQPWISGFYLFGVGLLCFHLSHGVQAMFQSVGLKTAAYESAIRWFAMGAALVLFLGYASVPTAVFLGVIR